MIAPPQFYTKLGRGGKSGHVFSSLEESKKVAGNPRR